MEWFRMVQGIMKNQEMPARQKEIAVKHSKNNIVRAIVLLKRADTSLTFADKSLEGTDTVSISDDIKISKRSLSVAISNLEKYIE